MQAIARNSLHTKVNKERFDEFLHKNCAPVRPPERLEDCSIEWWVCALVSHITETYAQDRLKHSLEFHLRFSMAKAFGSRPVQKG